MHYGLIGEKLGHSWSKVIHESFGIYKYELKELAPAELAGFLSAREFAGINVTIPYKKTVMPMLDEIAEDAAAVGAVNTIVNRDGKLIGHNTDRGGFLYMLRAGGIDPAGKKALILGTGGASLAVKAGLEAAGASEILFVSRKGAGLDGIVSYEQAAVDHADAKIIVNATPVGMYPLTDASPLDLTPFKACEAVADIIYNPAVTKLCRQAAALGMKAVTGLDMLIAQAVEAAGFFLGSDPDPAWFGTAKTAVEKSF
ncbi:MAG: shikimate dehydrogenase [Lachnospiraceae bacterium]|nr:shikimate dehydrogenase [Lachnospiraceae bacterium]